MTDYRLIYFDIDGGRAEHVRIAFHAAGIAFEDVRLGFEQFHEQRQAFRFTCVPVLEIDGQQVSQGDAMARYIGKQCGLYPTDPLQALYCDEAMGAVEDMTNHIGRTMRLEGDEQKQAREELAAGWMKTYLRGLGEIVQRGGGKYIADGKLSVADLSVFGMTRWLGSGFLDHIPQDIVASSAPALVDHCAGIEAEPVVVSYYQSRQ